MSKAYIANIINRFHKRTSVSKDQDCKELKQEEMLSSSLRNLEQQNNKEEINQSIFEINNFVSFEKERNIILSKKFSIKFSKNVTLKRGTNSDQIKAKLDNSKIKERISKIKDFKFNRK